MEVNSSIPKWQWKSCTILGLETIPYQQTIRWVWFHNQYLKVKCGVSTKGRWEAMEIRVESPRYMRDKDVESSIYNKMIQSWIFKRSSCGLLNPWSRLGHEGTCDRDVESLFSLRKIPLIGSSRMNFLSDNSRVTF